MEEGKIDSKFLKGTTIVAVLCKDGVVLAADKRATAGYVVSKKELKVLEIGDNMAVAQCGLVSDAQLLVKLIKAELRLKDLHTSRKTSVKEGANLLASFLYNNMRKFTSVPGIVSFLLGGVDESGAHIYDLGIDGSITEVDDFVADGSGGVFALGVLEQDYKKDLLLDDGVKLAVKALGAALKRDTATGNGIDVFTITKDGIKHVFKKIFEVSMNA